MYTHALQQFHSVSQVYKQCSRKCRVRRGPIYSSSSQEGSHGVHHCPHHTSFPFPHLASSPVSVIFCINYNYPLFTGWSLHRCTLRRPPGSPEDSPRPAQGDGRRRMFLVGRAWLSRNEMSHERYNFHLQVSMASSYFRGLTEDGSDDDTLNNHDGRLRRSFEDIHTVEVRVKSLHCIGRHRT